VALGDAAVKSNAATVGVAAKGAVAGSSVK
jgi:hypothetical protein